jgi:hypothetical protein
MPARLLDSLAGIRVIDDPFTRAFLAEPLHLAAKLSG